MKRIWLTNIAFDRADGDDPEAAAIALRAAGYEPHILPPLAGVPETCVSMDVTTELDDDVGVKIRHAKASTPNPEAARAGTHGK